MTEDELESLAKRCANHANRSNDNEWFGEAEQIANDAAYTAAFAAHNLALEQAARMADLYLREHAHFGGESHACQEIAEAIRSIIINEDAPHRAS